MKYDGINKIEITNQIKCEQCQYYIDHNGLFNISIDKFLKKNIKIYQLLYLTLN